VCYDQTDALLRNHHGISNHYLPRGDIEMTKKVLLALTFLVTSLFATNSFGQACSSGFNYQFVGAGSSAQFNTFAYAAYYGLGATNFWSTKGAVFQDTRFATPPTDSGVTMFVAYDNLAYCNVYIYVNIDSGIGVKDFFATAKQLSPPSRVYGAVFGQAGAWTSAVGGNQVPGITDTVSLPGTIQTFLTTSPAPAATTTLPQAYCGQIGVVSATTQFCFFNAGMTDIRPEDALYATTRALSSYSTANGLAGLGYNQASGCGSNTMSSNQGCPINDAFKQGKIFNVLNFKLSGTDPVTSATVPTYTTLNTGITPLIVIASDADTTSGGLGNGAGSAYTVTNINRTTLSNVFNGTSFCTGDLSNSTTGSSGDALNIIVREPLSGTYNAFEFTAVRTTLNSAATTVKQSSVSTKQWLSSDSAGQEFDPNNNLWNGGASPNGPLFNYADTTNCQISPKPYATGAVNCGNPLYNKLGTCGSTTAWKAREIGTKHSVLGTVGSDNVSGGLTVANGIGYAFWGYGNVEYAVSGCADATGDVTCSSVLGHYLTVDGIDPLFASSTARLDGSGNPVPGIAYTMPQCGAIVNNDGTVLPCQQITFPHVADGSYPLWSQLRATTFANVAGKQVVPAGVINMVAAAETEASNSSHYLSDLLPLLSGVSGTYSQGIGGITNTANSHTVTWASGNQFNTAWTGSIVINGTTYTIGTVNSATSITLTSNITAAHATAVPYSWNNGTYPKGNLNVGVFRSHFLQSGINPNNGHAACGGVFTSIFITGAAGTCLVDAGGDEGGAIQTIQSDVDFNNDFGLNVVNGVTYPNELYNLHQ
jgi:hypothetical protein